VQNEYRKFCPSDLPHNLQKASGVGSENYLGPCGTDIVELSAGQAVGHLWLKEVIGTRRAAANERFRQFHKFQPPNEPEELPRWIDNFLSMS
jgi:hypothetical protein